MLGKTSHLQHGPRCPSCNALLDGVTAVEGRHVPMDGDLSVCIACAAMLKFNAQLNLELLTTEEFAALPRKNQSDLFITQMAIKRLIFFERRGDLADDE